MIWPTPAFDLSRHNGAPRMSPAREARHDAATRAWLERALDNAIDERDRARVWADGDTATRLTARIDRITARLGRLEER